MGIRIKVEKFRMLMKFVNIICLHGSNLSLSTDNEEESPDLLKLDTEKPELVKDVFSLIIPT